MCSLCSYILCFTTNSNEMLVDVKSLLKYNIIFLSLLIQLQKTEAGKRRVLTFLLRFVE